MVTMRHPILVTWLSFLLSTYTFVHDRTRVECVLVYECVWLCYFLCLRQAHSNSTTVRRLSLSTLLYFSMSSSPLITKSYTTMNYSPLSSPSSSLPFSLSGTLKFRLHCFQLYSCSENPFMLVLFIVRMRTVCLCKYGFVSLCPYLVYPYYNHEV